MPVRLHPDLVFVAADGTRRNRAALLRTAAALQSRLDVDIALAAEDPFLLAAAILASFRLGRQPILLPDLSPESRAAAGQASIFGDEELVAVLDLELAPSDSSEVPEGSILLMSSGSGGGRKIIAKTWSQLVVEAQVHADFLELGAPQLLIAGSVSPRHLYGLLFRLILPLISARPAERFHRRLPDQMSSLLEKTPALFVSSPSALAALARQNASFVPGSLFLSSGGPLALADAELLGQDLLELYGSSETGGIARRSSPSQPWQLLPGVLCREEDESFSVSSPWLPEWQLSGDRRQDLGEGRFYLLGRADRLIKIGEKRFSLDDAERALRQLPGVLDAAIAELGPSGEMGRAQIGALIVDEQARGPLELRRELLAAGLDPLLIPRRFRRLDSLPRDPQGKLRRDLVRQLLLTPVAELPPYQRSESGVFSFQVPVESVVLDGHFPGQPILPGLAQVHWAWSLASRYFPLPSAAQSLLQLKFSRVIRPGDELELHFDSAPGSLAFRYLLHGETASSGRFQWTP